MSFITLALAVAFMNAAPVPPMQQHIQVSPRNVQTAQKEIPVTLREPLAAISRIATGMQANAVCNQLSDDEAQTIDIELRNAAKTLYNRLQHAGFVDSKAQKMLVQLMDEGEKLAQKNFPTCTKLAPEIIVKATQDAACINLYLAGTDLTCFR